MMNKLKELRHSRGISQQVVADLLHVTKATYSRYENGQFEPTQASLIKLADYFQVTIDYLLNRKNIKPSASSLTKIPVFHRITTHIPLQAKTDIEGYEEIPQKMAEGKNFFALRVAERCMEPEIRDQDIIIVSQQDSINSGDTAVILIGSEDAVVRNVKKTKDGILLIGYNLSAYTPHFYTRDELKNLPIKILGKVVEIRRKII